MSVCVCVCICVCVCVYWSYEEAFAKIHESTGISDIDELVHMCVLELVYICVCVY